MKKALITGINGQDGSYLAEYLLQQGYEVHGIVRRIALEAPTHHLWRLHGILDQIQLHPSTLDSFPKLFQILQKVQPQECYHLAAQSFVSSELNEEFDTMHVNVNGTHHLLSALQQVSPQCRVYFAGSSEMFGHVDEEPQNEHTPFRPRSVYGISKLAGFELARNYRKTYGMFVASGIMYNHESPRRSMEFVTRKITDAAAKIKLGQQHKLSLGNLEARRDWGHSQDYVKAMHAMLNTEKADDFVVATGVTHSVREFLDIAFKTLGLHYADHVVMNSQFFRSPEVGQLVGDASKARNTLNWKPKYSFEELVVQMVRSDYDQLKR